MKENLVLGRLVCSEPEVSLWDVVSLADFAGCDRDTKCSNPFDIRIIIGLVSLVLMELAYLWLMYFEFRKAPPVKGRGLQDPGIHVSWVESDVSASTSPDLEINL
ncbi:uncharacterized protein LOC133181947 isoform X2 [Saccostrea echinata]|uniref:uncharacterized protein LOC133181947 isoform X2 n=1 Tax=Saccostrea echinata TaxID=191078 RepID=UPI002A7F5E08|nr:uncharacterized protein LOC133181947 isoform X2 [Saccostrea echinata]